MTDKWYESDIMKKLRAREQDMKSKIIFKQVAFECIWDEGNSGYCFATVDGNDIIDMQDEICQEWNKEITQFLEVEIPDAAKELGVDADLVDGVVFGKVDVGDL